MRTLPTRVSVRMERNFQLQRTGENFRDYQHLQRGAATAAAAAAAAAAVAAQAADLVVNIPNAASAFLLCPFSLFLSLLLFAFLFLSPLCVFVSLFLSLAHIHRSTLSFMFTIMLASSSSFCL